MQSVKKNISLSAAALVVASVIVPPSVQAWSNPLERARKSIETEIGRGTGYIHNTARRTVSYKVKIRNPTSRGIHYRLNGAPQLLSGGYTRTHTGDSVSGPEISFDNGNSQTIEYALGRNSSYVFQWKRGVLDLYNN
jgi:hypothetical protein